MENRHKAIAICLSVLWLASLAIVYISSGIKYVTAQISNVPSTSPNDHIELWPIALIAFYFFPLLLLIKKYAILAKMSKLASITTALSLIFGAVLAMTPIVLLLMTIAL